MKRGARVRNGLNADQQPVLRARHCKQRVAHPADLCISRSFRCEGNKSNSAQGCDRGIKAAAEIETSQRHRWYADVRQWKRIFRQRRPDHPAMLACQMDWHLDGLGHLEIGMRGNVLAITAAVI